ncbi:hypothetical protein QBC35DRAFT_381774 [Podospora australis]|uniref:Glutamine amidotransferase type-2 domain-containing protein n=1 Tax=Podospora australis TaxID=1536484 RepID=A0AAN6WW60_9PEZI|nr:hypothetical protein QBC35DRAFT_381774 [Podospora australis]
MCGIHAVFSATPHEISPELDNCLRNRGPDYQRQVKRCIIRDDDVRLSLTLTSTVLALRGDHVAPQPLVDDAAVATGSVLCWNGEAWRIGGDIVDAHDNDGEAIFARLSKASALLSLPSSTDVLLEVFRAIEGPFAFVYYHEPSNTLLYGRDRLGRRSLMLSHEEETGTVTLCSLSGRQEGGAATGSKWVEVEADGIYSLKLGSSTFEPERHDWIVGDDAADFVSSIGKFNKALPASASVLTASSPSVAALKEHLLESLRLRVLDIPKPPSADAEGKTRVAVLFSGGLDCTVLARLCHDILDPSAAIDLLNVAFENPRVVAQLKKDAKGDISDFYEACPDRLTGRKSFAELQHVCPGRAFRFVAVNVPYTEAQAHRQQVISLIHPHNTEMDLSIGYALYFAARGQGWSADASNFNSPPAAYTTPARVLLSGLGADELFGGYSRHPSAFERQGYAGLVDELLLDVGRLGKRNLGRDDRVMSHWSKEVRFPFLDERLVRWAIATPAWEKCDFDNSEEATSVEAGKRVLRLVALELGMEGVAKEKKRAIQFGARTAKMESGRVKGTTLVS